VGPAGADSLADTGCPGPRINGTCVVSYDNRQQTTFVVAAQSCASRNADICTDSQYWPISVGQWQNIYLQTTITTTPHWTASFADNDSSAWNGVNNGTGDDHGSGAGYGYACCGGTTPPNPRVTPEVVSGVPVLTIHDIADTYFSGAVAQCMSLGGDICSESQTALLRAAGRLSTPTWTNAHSDNDGGQYAAINGGTSDDPNPSQQYGYACCASTLPANLTCPVNRTAGVCATVVRDIADNTFLAAAQACATAGADLCSIAQSAVLRSQGVLTGPVWTNSHSDNDAGNATVGTGPVPDNPNLNSLYGYACCRK
jgi:hypothetical protein